MEDAGCDAFRTGYSWDARQWYVLCARYSDYGQKSERRQNVEVVHHGAGERVRGPSRRDEKGTTVG